METEHTDTVVEVAAKLAGIAPDVDEVLVLYTLRNGGPARSLDNNVSVSTACFMLLSFEHWLMGCMSKASEEASEKGGT